MTENCKNENFDNKELTFLEKYFESKMEATEKALVLANENLKIRLEHMNEVRNQLESQAHTFVTKQETERIKEDIKNLQLKEAEVRGKASQLSAMIALSIAIIGIILGVINIFLK